MRRYLLALPFAAASSLFTAIPFALAQDEEQGERPPRPAPPAWLAALDVDGNGEISADELAQASESLGKLDANDDGVLQMNELQPRPNRRGPDGPRGPRGPVESQAGENPWSGPEFAGRDFPGRGPWMGRPNGPDRHGRPEGRGPGMRRGPGGPGMEGRGSLAPPKFEDVDANQDGAIDREEFDKAVRAMHPGGPSRERGELGEDNRGPRRGRGAERGPGVERGPGRGAGERPRRDRAPQQPPADSPIELNAEQNDAV